MKYRVGILTLSDKGSRGEREDLSGPAIAELVTEAGYEVVYQNLMSDEFEPMKAELMRLCDENVCDLLLKLLCLRVERRGLGPDGHQTHHCVYQQRRNDDLGNDACLLEFHRPCASPRVPAAFLRVCLYVYSLF